MCYFVLLEHEWRTISDFFKNEKTFFRPAFIEGIPQTAKLVFKEELKNYYDELNHIFNKLIENPFSNVIENFYNGQIIYYVRKCFRYVWQLLRVRVSIQNGELELATI